MKLSGNAYPLLGGARTGCTPVKILINRKTIIAKQKQFLFEVTIYVILL
jgi:hypothetical protein